VYSFLVSYNLNRFMPHPTLDIYWCIFTTLFWSDGATNVGGERSPTRRGGVEAEEEEEGEEEVLQGLLHCSMCRNDHCLGYVITSRWLLCMC
jgi:hypothetical protein